MKANNLYFDINFIKTLFPTEKIEIKKGETLFTEEQNNDFVYFIQEGKLKVTQKENVIGYTRANEFIGITSCLCEGDYFYFTSYACENSTLLKIDKLAFKQALSDNPDFGKVMIEILCRRIKITDNKTKIFTSNSTQDRIINELINNSIFETEATNPLLSIDELSELTGVSNVKVLTVLKDLSSKNVIRIKEEKISILELEKLKDLVN